MTATRREFLVTAAGAAAAGALLKPIRLLAEDAGVPAGAWTFPSCGPREPGPFAPGRLQSLHVPMRDGVRIALDVLLPQPLAEAKVTTILTMTRYLRGRAGGDLDGQQKLFSSHGYAVVIGDVRGTGASFGRWPHHRSRAETEDFGDVIDWIVRQPWSDGRVVGWGVSYTANTVDWMVERNRRALKAVISRCPDYDPYADLYFPGGVPNAYMGRVWGGWVKDLDLNISRRADGSPLPGVRLVDGPEGAALLAQAIDQRRDVPSVWEGLQDVTFRDDEPKSWGGASIDEWGIHSHRRAVEAAGTPMQQWATWMDAGTANGVLHRFMTLSNPQSTVIGPWSHGGGRDSNPYRPADAPTSPSYPDQQAEDLCFIEQVLASGGGRRGSKQLIYYTIGEERWKVTREWPLPTTRMQAWYFSAARALATSTPAIAGIDRYAVDFSASTGRTNRWATNNTGGDVDYGNRAEADQKLLTYTSAVLDQDIEITGQPVITLYIASTHTDGNFFAYLEDIAPDGFVRYLTEGQLRALHRKISKDPPPYRVLGPYHSFRRRDALPLRPGSIAELQFELMPISVLVRAGHRLRLAIAGADADTFTRVPAQGDPTISVHWGREHASHIMLPIIPRSTG